MELFPSLSIVLVMQCLGLAMLSYSFRTFRWIGYMRLKDRQASINRHIIIYLSGFAFTASPGKTGELMRGVYLDRLGIPFRYTFMSFLSERFFDVIIALFLGTYFLIGHFGVAFCVLSGALLILPFTIYPCITLALSLTKEEIWLESLRALRSLWGMVTTLKSQLCTLLAWSAQGLILSLMLQGVGVEVSIAMAISIYCLSLLIGAASLIPSGLGVTEVGMIWLLTQIGVDSSIAIIASLITRMLTLWPAIGIGLICAFVLKKFKKEPLFRKGTT